MGREYGRKSMRQKNKRLIKQEVGILVLAFLLCLFAGCGKNSANNGSEHVSATATVTPTATPTPEPWESYEKEGERRVYRVPVAELTEDLSVMNTAIAGEYVLLQLWGSEADTPGPEWGKLVLLRPAESGMAAVFTPDFPVRSSAVLADGNVVLEDSYTGAIHVYDKTLKETKSYTPAGTQLPGVFDVTQDGRIWMRDIDRGIIRCTDLNGENAAEYEVGAGRNVYQNLGSSDGKTYFRAMDTDEDMSDIILCLDKAGTVAPVEERVINVTGGGVSRHYDTAGNMLRHFSEETWFLKRFAEDGHWITLPQYYRFERIDSYDEEKMCVSGFIRGMESGSDMSAVPKGCRVYDIAEKKVLAELFSMDIPSCESFNVAGMLRGHLVVITAFDGNGTVKLVLWDMNDGTPETLHGCYDLTAETLSECLRKLWKEYAEAYGISYAPSTLQNMAKDEDIEILQQIDFANMLARGVADNPAEFPKRGDGSVLTIENIRGHERGHSTFEPHVFTDTATKKYGEAQKKSLLNLVDAIRAGEEWFDCGERVNYNFSIGFFVSWYYPASSGCVKTSYDYRDKDQYKNGRGRITYTVPKEQAAEGLHEFEQMICSILDDSYADDYTDFEKALALYEFVSEYCTYDYDMYAHIEDPEWTMKGSIYRAFRDRTGICWEIAGLYNYLLNQSGIPADEVTGMCSENHAWTHLQLDGVGYFCDATWSLTTDRYPTLAYFLFTEDERAKRDSFDPKSYTMFGEGDLSLADFACDAKDARYEALWNGKYVGMDRTAKKVIYLDDTGVLHSFSYGK